MSICITGGAGYIGKALAHALVQRGESLHVLSRQRALSGGSTQIKHFEGDLLDSSSNFDDYLQDANVLYHCAGEIKNEANMHALHVEGTQRLLDAVETKIQASKQAFHWVQLSSVGAYGPPPSGAAVARTVTEATPAQPIGTYEVTKTLADESVMALAEQEPLFTYTILRPSIVISNDMPNHSVRSLAQMMRRGLFFYIGDRTSIANYVHLNDVVDALVLCGADPRAKGQVFNLSNDCLFSTIVEAVRNKASIQFPTLCVPEWPLRVLAGVTPKFVKNPLTADRIDVLVRHTTYSSQKLKERLGFEPTVQIPTAICQMLA
jgi:nucleoside-diphosphate-sugar epimerase